MIMEIGIGRAWVNSGTLRMLTLAPQDSLARHIFLMTTKFFMVGEQWLALQKRLGTTMIIAKNMKKSMTVIHGSVLNQANFIKNLEMRWKRQKSKTFIRAIKVLIGKAPPFQISSISCSKISMNL